MFTRGPSKHFSGPAPSPPTRPKGPAAHYPPTYTFAFACARKAAGGAGTAIEGAAAPITAAEGGNSNPAAAGAGAVAADALAADAIGTAADWPNWRAAFGTGRRSGGMKDGDGVRYPAGSDCAALLLALAAFARWWRTHVVALRSSSVLLFLRRRLWRAIANFASMLAVAKGTVARRAL